MTRYEKQGEPAQKRSLVKLATSSQGDSRTTQQEKVSELRILKKSGKIFATIEQPAAVEWN